MADNLAITPGTVATDDIGSAHYQRVKLTLGADGVNGGDVAPGNPMPTVQRALQRTVLLNAVAVTGAGAAVADSGFAPSFHGHLAGTGAISATVDIQGRNVASGAWVTLGTLEISGTTTAADAFATATRYMEYRAEVTAISGTGAALTVAMGS